MSRKARGLMRSLGPATTLIARPKISLPPAVFRVDSIPSVKSCRKFLARTREWILKHRHWRRWEQQEHLTKMLRGFYQYFGLHHCERKLKWVRQQVQRQWISALNRRGQRRRTNWTRLKDR